MKTMRIPLYIALGIGIIGLIFGSIFDLQISTAIGNPNNYFAITVSVLGPTFGFLAISFIGGGFLALGLKKERFKTFARVLFIIAAVGAYGVSVYFAGKEYFNSHGFHKALPSFVGYLIAAVPLAGGFVGGFFVLKKSQYQYDWIILIIIAAVAFMALVPAVTLIKEIFHRPRFRTVINYSDIEFHQWWQPCANYKELMAAHGLISEEFKSFPSGHTTEASLLMIPTIFMPLISEKFKKYQVPAFFIAFAFALLVALGRILAAAHYLSDVSMGFIIVALFNIIANEIVIHVKKLHPEEAPAA